MATIQGCPVWKLPYIMPYEELMCWKYRYTLGKFGKKLNDYRFATQAKITDLCFSDGKFNPPVEKYIPEITIIENETVTNKNLLIANAILGGIVPKEVIKNVYCSQLNGPSET